VHNSGGRPTSGLETLEVISPELALVDPELATRARASLRTYDGDELVAAVKPPHADEIAPEPSGDEETVLSPELALVDPVLAAWARTRLPDLSHVSPVVRKQPAPVASPEVVQADGSAPRGPYAEGTPSPGRDDSREAAERPRTLERRPARHMRSLGRATLAAAAFVLVAAGVLVGDVIRQHGRTLPAAFNFTVQTAANAPPARAAPHATDSAKRQPSATSVASARGFVWVPVAATSAYDVEFYRAGRRIFAARTTHPKLTVAKSWTYRGRRERFTPGTYRWYVWPIYKSGSGGRGTPIVNSVLIVSG
jgi:hypothetical protein